MLLPAYSRIRAPGAKKSASPASWLDKLAAALTDRLQAAFDAGCGADTKGLGMGWIFSRCGALRGLVGRTLTAVRLHTRALLPRPRLLLIHPCNAAMSC